MTTDKHPGGRPPFYSDANALARFLADHGISRTEAAADLDVSTANISSIVLGKSRPSADLMRAIEQWTRGAVSMQSWFAPDPKPPKPRLPPKAPRAPSQRAKR